MQAIIDKLESEEEARASRAEVNHTTTTRSLKREPTSRNHTTTRRSLKREPATSAKKIGSDKYKTHDTQFCRLRNKNKKPNQKFKSKSFNVGVENSPE